MRAYFTSLFLVFLALPSTPIFGAETDRATTESVIVHESDPTESAHNSARIKLLSGFNRFRGGIQTEITGDSAIDLFRSDQIRDAARDIADAFFLKNVFDEHLTSYREAHKSYLNDVMWKELRVLIEKEIETGLLTREYLQILLSAFEETQGMYKPKRNGDFRWPEVLSTVAAPAAIEGGLRLSLFGGGLGIRTVTAVVSPVVKLVKNSRTYRVCSTALAWIRRKPSVESSATTLKRSAQMPVFLTNNWRKLSILSKKTIGPVTRPIVYLSTSRHRFWFNGTVLAGILWWPLFSDHRVWAQSIEVTDEIITYLSAEILRKSKR